MSNPVRIGTRLPRTRTLAATSAAALLALPAAALAGGASSGASASIASDPLAHATSTLNATDTAHLHYIRSSGAELVETGTATGTLPGRMQAHVNIGATISGNFTIDVRGGGTINGHGTATPHGSGTYESFSGSLVINGGSGRYAHAHGHAGLYGTFNRKTYALVVQTTGQFSY